MSSKRICSLFTYQLRLTRQPKNPYYLVCSSGVKIQHSSFATDRPPVYHYNDELLSKKVDFYSGYKPSALSMQQFVEFGQDGDQTLSFRFLRKELLVRLANMMSEFNMIPEQLQQARSTQTVREWYERSFQDLLIYEDSTISQGTMSQFTEDLKVIYDRHKTVVQTMAEGLMEYKDVNYVDAPSEKMIQYFLDRFYINRISIRMLISQHILLFGGGPLVNIRHVGSVDPICDVQQIIEDSYESAKFLCENYYMACPKMKIETQNAIGPDPINIVYVPSHLFHIMFELFKNAMRATVELHDGEDDLPTIKIFLVRGKEDLSIKICDRGGGVPRSIVDHLFNYLYTTAPKPEGHATQAPLAGLGYGLPISRLYARYFQGDLQLVSMEGHGTDACVYLKALSSDAMEVLPVYGSSSRMQYRRKSLSSDWSTPYPGFRS